MTITIDDRPENARGTGVEREPLAAASSCHGSAGPAVGSGEIEGVELRAALVGAPNVGKSSLFNRLTGAYVTVSNYPGTSVGVDRGHGDLGGRSVEV
ncbi:MAG: hypothetical protein GWM90_11380, partial [Gemmatimonadetes bacterium]|nr:hypothetical protein [Gemmatimonadota bacterium]NIU74795.1 hypothetical protein [Gammaproteobacteria bacterium]NIP79778.1 hypothetical protein [Gemmatimonadota bacterium]NIQ54587.1 hypothetical protein [Gemmatimonadota bacterium]NIX44695.1 hypothetical protein [Gemmatimonadota bacterium]